MGTDDNGYELAVCHQPGKAANLFVKALCVCTPLGALRPRRAGQALALARLAMLPSTQSTVSASRRLCFRGSIPSRCAPRSMLHQNPRGFQRLCPRWWC